MRLKSLKKIQQSKFNLFLKLYFFVTILFGLFFIIFILNSGYWKEIKDRYSKRFFLSGTNNYLKIYDIGFKSIISNFYEIDNLNLNISFKNRLKLEKDRDEVLKIDATNPGTTFKFKEVKAVADYKEKKINISLRIKGDRRIHFEDKKHTSYKVDVKKDKKLFGLETFSLIKPRSKNYIHEWLYHELLGEGDLIKLKYDFINLSINGQNSGLYALEESMDKILLERNKKRNGPIFGVVEEYSRNFENIKLQVYNKKYWQSVENIEFTQKASSKLESFFSNLLDENDFNDLIDVEKWAWFFAVHDINNYDHGSVVKSVKFYYNPISGKIEPIGLDGHRVTPNFSNNYDWESVISKKGISTFDKAKNCDVNKYIKCNLLLKKFFFKRDGKLRKDFFEKYRQSVLKISSKEFLDDFFQQRKEKINFINSKIYGDYFLIDHVFKFGPGLYFFDKVDFYKKADILKKYFSSEPEKIFASQDKNKLIINNLSLNNNYKVKKIYCFNVIGNEKIIDVDKKISESLNIIYLSQIINNSNENFKCSKLELINNFSQKIMKIKIDHLNTIDKKKNYLKFKDQKNLTLKRHNNYFKKIENKLFLKNDSIIIDKDIFIPKGYEVILKPGQKINIKNGAFIFSKSPWTAEGEKQKKILITGDKNNFGGGLIISEPEKASYFKNVNFLYLEGLKNENHIILGSINFYNTNLKLENISFEKISSEDALNIMNSNFEINNINFSENSSDAVDFDFSSGFINNVNFKDIGNDAIDFSGSKVTVKNASFININDKVISAGENSDIKIFDINAINSYAGIVVKDGSIVKAEKIVMNGVKFPFASLIKKNEYEMPRLFLKNINIEDFLEKWLVDRKSKIWYDNLSVGKFSKNILPIFYEEKNYN